MGREGSGGLNAGEPRAKGEDAIRSKKSDCKKGPGIPLHNDVECAGGEIFITVARKRKKRAVIWKTHVGKRCVKAKRQNALVLAVERLGVRGTAAAAPGQEDKTTLSGRGTGERKDDGNDLSGGEKGDEKNACRRH